ncbi:hypothetical protein QMK61_04265 [Fulvimonas sp. R45]|uniref:hypothetical protein n=1 Tax=Fulvimonas sp. R45 TaxID=3045937 RepID=UPI00265F8D35|nr:hypothetical protein [Fulvimonas sp. R45]MDO1528041.1 hypothetical protein [Fulvimonas sp. R45]
MPMRLAFLSLLGTAALSTTIGAHAQPVAAATDAPPSRNLLAELHPLPNDLARHQYLQAHMPADDDNVARQVLAALDDQLGLYNRALADFPFDNRVVPPPKVPLPATDAWRAESAVAAIAARAQGRRIVMINEAHHDAHTRELTLELLPKLYAHGFRYLAIEALGPRDKALARRGYAIDTSGSSYLREPLYGEIVRQALRLGYTLVSYDSDAPTPAGRESGQARNLYREVFARDPRARLLVHAGYAHVDEAPGNLGDTIEPMAMQLARLTGLDPLTVDQTQFRDIIPGAPDDGAYGVLVERFHPRTPVVLVNRLTDKLWSADPARHDISVILPRAGTGPRPDWLSLGGRRKPRLVNTDLCNGHVPCMVEARYAGEAGDAVPADRYTFLHEDTQNTLYLYPGQYRLRAVDAAGHVLGTRTLDVGH